MYKLLIVDDEEMIVDWLFELFQEVDEIELDVYRAYSGDEAIALLNKIKIDVVLTDIRMPGMDGLELLKRIRQNWPDCRVIFLTGYNEFNYVYTAIQYEGVRYLLKTEDDEAIIDAVKNAVKDIENSLQVEKLIQEAENQMRIARPLLQKEYLTDLLLGESSSKEMRVRQFEEIGIPLNGEEPVLLLLGRIDNAREGISAVEKSQVLYGIKALSDKYLLPSVSCAHIMLDNAILLWFIQPKDVFGEEEGQGNESWNKTLLFVKETLESIQSMSKRLLNISLSFVMDSSPVEWERVSERFDKLKFLLNCRIGLGTEMIITDDSFFYHGSIISETNSRMIQKAYSYLKRIGKLEGYLERGNREEYFKLLSKLLGCLNEVTGFDSDLALEIYYSISLTLLSYINRWNLSRKSNISRIGLYKLTRADEHGSWAEAGKYLYDLSEMLFELQSEEQENCTGEVISRIKEYVYSHLEDDLSIITLAELVHFNPSYLSRLFKQVTGTNLSDFIAEAKLNRARELLEKTDLKIYEIARAIGYESPSYFNRFFKNSVGMTPQEYRLSFLKSDS